MKRLFCVLLVFILSGLPALASDSIKVKPVVKASPFATLKPTPTPAPTQDRGSIIDSGAGVDSIPITLPCFHLDHIISFD